MTYNPVVQAAVVLFGTIFVLFGIRDLATDIFWGMIAFWLGIAWVLFLYWYIFVSCPAALEEHLNRLFDDRRR